MIVLELTESMFISTFVQYDRGDQFSYKALQTLYSYYSSLGSEYNPCVLDVVAVCCDWAEEPLKDILEVNPDIKTLADLQEHTVAISLDNGYILYLPY